MDEPGAGTRDTPTGLRRRAGGAQTGRRQDGGGSRTLARGLSVLEALAAAPSGCTVAELSGATGLDRAVLYRLLETLADRGYVDRDPDTRRFRLGVALVELGARAGRGIQVRRLAMPVMRKLLAQAREVICLAVRDGLDAVVVDRLEPHGLLGRVGYHVGFRHPLSVGAHGRALLAFLNGVDRAACSHDNPQLAAELERSRARGFAVSADELERGACGVAAPILDRRGTAIASLGIVAPSPRLPDPQAVGPRVRAAALEVSRRLGYPGAGPTG